MGGEQSCGRFSTFCAMYIVSVRSKKLLLMGKDAKKKIGNIPILLFFLNNRVLLCWRKINLTVSHHS